MGKLRDFILDGKNIYNAIYSLESYIGEKYLLSPSDIELYRKLSDKYNFKLISDIISQCQKRLKDVLELSDDLFELNVYFKLKSIDDNKNIKYRPIHTASLIDQICMVCLLNPIMFDDVSGKRELSEISLLLPHNFFGNLPSTRVEEIFQPWPFNYKRYNEEVENKAKEYQETYEYKTQICLDLEDFFPSIDPKFILNFVYSKLSSQFSTQDDENDLKMLLTKLLYFKIKGKEFKEWANIYYKKNVDVNEYYNRGIAQGLPQGLFFGNLAMIAISKVIAQVFPGDAYYYVDDSVIFSKESFDDDEHFTSLIKKVNEKLSEIFSKKQWGVEPCAGDGVANFVSSLSDYPRCHEKDKSFYAPLLEKNSPNLWKFPYFTREVSIAGNFSDNFEDIDDIRSEKKLDALLKALDDYIKNLAENGIKGRNAESKLKFLKRYRKYFEYQRMLARFKNQQDSLVQYQQNFSDTFKFDGKDNKIEELFEKLDEGIFRAEYRFLIEQYNESGNDVKDIVQDLDEKLAFLCLNKKDSSLLYYKKDVNGCLDYKKLRDHSYETLERDFLMKKHFLTSIKGTDCQFDFLLKNHKGELLKYLFVGDCGGEEFYVFISGNSQEFWRKILNALASTMFDVKLDESQALIKRSQRKMRYFELRILMYLRNFHFNLVEYQKFLSDLMTVKHGKDINEMPVDLSLLHVLDIFVKHVQKPQCIDNLIMTHAIVKGLWMNGSKFLYSYTLHNEEHAVELIRQCVRIIRTIDIISIKQSDFYILFLACYLHDLSMVVQPNLSSFAKENQRTDRLATECLLEIKERSKNNDWSLLKVKEMMEDIFQRVFSYFEESVRTSHPEESANFIRKRMNEFFFYIDESQMDVVAKVAESHGWDSGNVYGHRSYAKKELVSLKYMMILIRLADLLDMSKDRVNYFLLRENMRNLAPISAFHWITHYITNNVELTSEYDYINGKIKETIIVNIELNINKRINSTHNSLKCGHWKADLEGNVIRNTIGESGDQCRECKLACKWMHYKNEWLFSELYELQKYINLINVSLFETHVLVNLKMDSNNKIDQDLYDQVLNFLGE